MALAAAVQGALRPEQQITWTDADGDAVNLTGATITARIRNLSSGVSADSTGNFTLVDAAGGVFVWSYSSADVATAGQFVAQFTAAYSSPPTPERTIAMSWTVHEAI